MFNVQKFTYEIRVACSELYPKVHVPVFYVYLDKSERQWAKQATKQWKFE